MPEAVALRQLCWIPFKEEAAEFEFRLINRQIGGQNRLLGLELGLG